MTVYPQNRLTEHCSISAILILVFFIVSCINGVFLTAWLILLPICLVATHGKEGAIFALLQITFRSILNSGIVCAFPDYAGKIKWAVIFLLSFYLIFGRKLCEHSRQLKSVFASTGLYAVIAVISAFFVSSYPVTSFFKVISWIIPYFAIFIGVYETRNHNWMGEISKWLGILCFSSIVFIRTGVGYLVNGRGFQGLFNHPNMLGMVLVFFVAAYLYKTHFSLKTILVVAFATVLSFLSASRTSLFSIILIVIVWVLFSDISISKKIAICTVALGIVLFAILFDNGYMEGLMSFVYKGHEESILFSRENQLEYNIDRFKRSPLFGTGFNVPYKSGIKSYSFSFDLITENGNLLFALLADTGIIGFLLFLRAYFKLFMFGDKNFLVLFICPFLVSMGEMIFFSTNNTAVIAYVFLAVYFCTGIPSENYTVE